MDDKEKIFFDPSIPLILKKEIDNPPLILNKEIDNPPLVLNKEIDNPPLVLNKEMNLSPNNKNSKNNEILKIKDLVKLKYLSTDKFLKKKTSDNFIKDLTSIKYSAKKINNDIKEKTMLIDDSIMNQKKKIQLLYDEKKSLDQNRIEFNENKNKIQSDIINNQIKLIENNKKDNIELKVALDKLEKKLKESVNTSRSLEINNHELNNSLNRHIALNKKLDKEIKQSKNTIPKTSLNTDQINHINDRIDDRIKFYQEENIRLSSELSSFQKKYETISKNYNEVEFEKNSIFKQIQELNNSLSKTDFVGTSFSNDNTEENSINNQEPYDVIDDNSNIIQKNTKSDKDKDKDKGLDGEITDIFN
jgi:chromosome segregation ATPase